MFEPNILISSDDHNSGFPHEVKQLNNFKAMLKGVPPPSSITISKITVEDMLDCYKNNEKSFGLGLTSEKKDFSCSKENSIPFLNFLNSSCNTETIASLMQKVQERYIQLETLSSCNIWFKSILQSIGSSNKQYRVRQNVGTSPGRRLSHLARRRQYFSCANLQQIANFEKTRQIEIKKNKYEDKYKKITQNITVEKLNSSKRALFLSPESETPKKYESFGAKERKPFSPKFDENKRLPFQENSKKLEVSKWLSEQNFNIDFPRKRLRDECLNHTLETKRKCSRRSLNFENEEVPFSSNNRTLDNNGFSDKKMPIIINKLSQNHKNKLLWAVSIVLKENKILRSDDIFKICASTLFHKCRKNLNEIFSLETANGTSEKMLQYARSQISSVFQELNIHFPTANSTLKENKIQVQNNMNLMNKLVNKFPSVEESKENILERKIDESHRSLLDDELHLLFKTPRKISRKRTVRSCQKGAAKVNERRNNLKRCRSLESLIRTNIDISFSNILKDLRECKFSCKEGKYDEKELSNISNSEVQCFEPNIFINSKDDSNNTSESISSGIEHIENNETSNSFSPDLADKDISLIFSPIPTSEKNFDSPKSLFPALCLNSYNCKESFDCDNYTPNTDCSREISDQDQEMRSKFVLFASNENLDYESQYLKHENSDNSSNEVNECETGEKNNSKPYECFETEICDISTDSPNKEIKTCNKKATIDNFDYDINHTDSCMNKSLNDSAEMFDKLIVHQSSCVTESEAVGDLNNSDQIAGEILETDTENECNLMISSNIMGEPENISSPSLPERYSIEKGIYKPRKLVFKKSKANWKVVRQNSEEAENISDLKLKMRLSHEWEVIHRASYSSDATNNSENEGNSFSSSQVSSINDDGDHSDIKVESDRDCSILSFHEDIKTTNVVTVKNCSEDKLIQNLEDNSALNVQLNKLLESKNKLSEIQVQNPQNRNDSLSAEDVNISISSFASHSCESESFASKDDCICLESGKLQETNLSTMNLSEKCIMSLKEKESVECKVHNGIAIKPDILNEKHDFGFLSCGNKLINENELEFQTDQVENSSMLNTFKENLHNGNVTHHLRNEKNENTFEVKDHHSSLQKKTDENIKTAVVDVSVNKEVLHERANVIENHNLCDHYFEKKDNCKDHLLNNTQEDKSEVCLESSTISSSTADCSSSAEEFENTDQRQEKNSPSRCEKTDALWEKDNVSLNKLENCISNLIPDHTEKDENSIVLTNTKPTKRFLSLESYKARKIKEFKDLEAKIPQSKNAEDAEEIFHKQDNCNLKNSKKKIYNIKLKHPISEYRRKPKYDEKIRRECGENRHYLKGKINVSDNLNCTNLTQEKEINNVKSISDDDSLATQYVSTIDKDKFIFKSKDLLKAPVSKSCVSNDNDINLALQPKNSNCNKFSDLNGGEKKTENISVQTIVSALSALSTLVEEQIKLENEKMKTKQSNRDKQKSSSEPENFKSNWLDVVSYWCGKNLNNLKSEPDVLSESFRFADNNMNAAKHFMDMEKSEDCEVKMNNLKKMIREDFTKSEMVVKYKKEKSDISPSQKSDSVSKNKGEVLETKHSNGNFGEIRSTAFKKMSIFPRERLDTSDNAWFYANHTSHSLNGTENSYYNYNPIPVHSNCNDTFNIPNFQPESVSEKCSSQIGKYGFLKHQSTPIQHHLKPVDIDCEFMTFGLENRTSSQNYFLETNEENQLFSDNVKQLSVQSDQNYSCYGSVLNPNVGFFQSGYGRHGAPESSKTSNLHFQNSNFQRPMSIETKHLEVVNGSAMSVYNSRHLTKSLWPQSNFQCRSDFSQNQQLSEHFKRKFPPLSSLETSSYCGSQNDCASDVHMQFKSPNVCSQKQPPMFYQFNNIRDVYSSWQFPPDPNSCNYKQNVLNDEFQNSNAFSYQFSNIPYYINYFR